MLQSNMIVACQKLPKQVCWKTANPRRAYAFGLCLQEDSKTKESICFWAFGFKVLMACPRRS